MLHLKFTLFSSSAIFSNFDIEGMFCLAPPVSEETEKYKNEFYCSVFLAYCNCVLFNIHMVVVYFIIIGCKGYKERVSTSKNSMFV